MIPVRARARVHRLVSRLLDGLTGPVDLVPLASENVSSESDIVEGSVEGSVEKEAEFTLQTSFPSLGATGNSRGTKSQTTGVGLEVCPLELFKDLFQAAYMLLHTLLKVLYLCVM